jgi:hypothetical protein
VPFDPTQAARTALGPRRERAWQAALLREVFGDPFRPVCPEAAWLAGEDGCVGKVARALYEEGAFDEMPILADALEEAGCTDEQVLAHCRGGGEHVRGCWVVDLVLRRV